MGRAWAGDATGIDSIHDLVECANRGACKRTTGLCNCDAGFTGTNCATLACFASCSSSGQCLSMQAFAAAKSPFGFTYIGVWDAASIHGCVCDAGTGGPDCSLQLCPPGDDPMTIGQFNEKQLLRCTGVGSFQLKFNGELSTPIPSSATAPQLTNCCSAGSNVATIEFTSRFGPQPPFLVQTVNAQKLPSMTGGNVIVAHGGAAIGTFLSVRGSKECQACSNRGLCDTSQGTCSCYLYPMPGYRSSDGYGNVGLRGDCGAPDNTNYYGGPISGCPGYLPCSGHGMCTGPPGFACKCSPGWTSGDCSQRTCTTGASWFALPTSTNVAHKTQETCSNAGLCDSTTGMCTCFPPFTGAACELLDCPYGPDSAAPCSGHGTCLTLAELAASTTTQGLPAGFTYGANPNNPATWDAAMIQGCKCDDGFTGHDCTQRVCPTGDDPVTMGQTNAVQQVTCAASSGVFQLGFRGAYTDPLPFNAPVLEVQTALLSLSTIHGLSLQYSHTGACVGGNSMILTFTQDFGALPPVQLLDASLMLTSPSSVTTLVPGTKEDAECANHGHCDTNQGVCVCARDYASSDGNGGPGNRGDCGYRRLFFVDDNNADAKA
ncbi:hypothetical protein SPRG_19293 [Saprolegnia parasitica CBS 223.65]|uniref:EGF-like domain-containing protein n=1 Tax=Saprolegnia parasitica (strain CBS 223.65) TaxID=695850 RepID=A0A067D4T2_SAPPC|nr:hypothetical protein SPRG_19293 [Saprolegnia parasitica CBS 223.65]KDO33681.1 hypothetical protein SPRG_19293 [Saprolegnia parasitica CBS 223.65]|eukprot:XP_012195708.1 hypothetical protein SPRG_19293 [Saprolegnia parasitica CBS 223.65]